MGLGRIQIDPQFFLTRLLGLQYTKLHDIELVSHVSLKEGGPLVNRRIEVCVERDDVPDGLIADMVVRYESLFDPDTGVLTIKPSIEVDRRYESIEEVG